jgi:hypothetical protein
VSVKRTGPLQRVLRVFWADACAHHDGYDLMKAATHARREYRFSHLMQLDGVKRR